MTSLLALENAWFKFSPHRAEGGRRALAGFNYQLAVSLRTYLDAVVDGDASATVAFDGLSDLAQLRGDLIYVTQIKRTLSRKSQKSAVAEFLEIDRFLEQDHRSVRDRVHFRIICSRAAPRSYEEWDPTALSLDSDEAQRWQQIRDNGRFVGCTVEGDPRLELAIRLWKTVRCPYTFVNAGIAKLQHLLGKNRSSEEIAEALLQDLDHAKLNNTTVGTLLGPRDFERAGSLSERILIGQRPRLEDLREGCFMERPGRVRPVLDMLDRAIPLDSSLRDAGRKVPVVWISGGSGAGKSALLLQSLQEIVREIDLPVIYLKHFFQELPGAIQSAGSGPALIAADDLYAPDQRDPSFWSDVNKLAHTAPGITLLACGPDEHRESFAEVANRHGVLSVCQIDLPPLTEEEQNEYFQWFCDRTGATDLAPCRQANFVVAAFTLDRARQGDPSLEEFAARFKQRLQNLGVYDMVLVTLAVNRFGIQPPLSFFAGAEDELGVLEEERLIWLKPDPSGKRSVSFHAAIGRMLYDIYRPERFCRAARARDIADYFRAIAGDHEQALSLIRLLGGGKKASKRIPEQFAIDALEEIWTVLNRDEPPHLKIGLLLECKRAVANRRPEAIQTLIEADRVLRWMGSSDVDTEGWALLLQIVSEVLAPGQRQAVCQRAMTWLEDNLDLAPWNYVWQLLWEGKFERVELTRLAHSWLESHVEDEAWNCVFQPLVDSGERSGWLLENARQSLTRGPATLADIWVWDKAKDLGLRDSEAAALLLVRLCKSTSRHVVSQGVKRFAGLRPVVDPAVLARIFNEYAEEPGSSYAFTD
ncbi:MAG: hypothetical protein ACREX9_11325, partial [Gammaproteobacteria bacterium]